MTDGKMSPTNINYNFVDHDFTSAPTISRLLDGRNFSREVRADDTTAYLINETGVKNIRLIRTARQESSGRYLERSWRMKDFNYRSLHMKVEPVMFALTNELLGRISILPDENDDLPATVARIQQRWDELVPHLPFDYQFLDTEFDRQYKADQQLSKVVGIFTRTFNF